LTTSLLGRSYVSRARVSGETVLAYVDESGNPGVYPKGSSSYVLACLMINARDWPKALDGMIGFRRWVRARFGVPMRAEIKANYLIRNSGPFRDLALSETARRTIYRQAMRMPAKIEARVFGMVIRKMELEAIRPGVSPRDVAWEYLLQRLERVMTTEDATLLLIHDEGDEAGHRHQRRQTMRPATQEWLQNRRVRRLHDSPHLTASEDPG